MLVTSTLLSSLRVGFNTQFQNAFNGVPKQKDRVAMTVRSSTLTNTYGWLKNMTGMREWLGPRQIDNLAEAAYTITNRDFEKTVGVKRTAIEDDTLGIYSLDFAMLGEAAARLPEELVWGLLKSGFATNCWDGQFFFDTDHPVTLADGSASTYANTDGGAGTPWFLICSNRPMKPIVFQDRKAPTFVSKDRPEDDNVFDRGEFLYGVDMRCNVGFGLPQMAWGSKQTLNAANYEIARTAIMSFKADGGALLGLVPDLLVVPPTLEGAAKGIVQSQLVNGGESNKWAGTAEVLVSPWLA